MQMMTSSKPHNDCVLILFCAGLLQTDLSHLLQLRLLPRTFSFAAASIASRSSRSTSAAIIASSVPSCSSSSLKSPLTLSRVTFAASCVASLSPQLQSERQFAQVQMTDCRYSPTASSSCSALNSCATDLSTYYNCGSLPRHSPLQLPPSFSI